MKTFLNAFCLISPALLHSTITSLLNIYARAFTTISKIAFGMDMFSLCTTCVTSDLIFSWNLKKIVCEHVYFRFIVKGNEEFYNLIVSHLQVSYSSLGTDFWDWHFVVYTCMKPHSGEKMFGRWDPMENYDRISYSFHQIWMLPSSLNYPITTFWMVYFVEIIFNS